jgi:hypothetical protein
MTVSGTTPELPTTVEMHTEVSEALVQMHRATIDSAFRAVHTAAYERLAELMEDMHRAAEYADPGERGVAMSQAWARLAPMLELLGVR